MSEKKLALPIKVSVIFFDQLKQILQNTMVNVRVSKLADGFGEQDTIYEQTKIEEWALYKVHIFWEGHKILPNIHLTFVECSASQK